MPGNILLKEQALLTLTSAGLSLTSGSAGAAGTLDCRSGGNAADMFAALFALTAQWSTVTGIVAGASVADLYLVPALDGSTYPDIDVTAGASYIPFPMLAGSFVSAKLPTATTNTVFQSAMVDLMPTVYAVYIINRSGQTMLANWSLKALAAAAQYT